MRSAAFVRDLFGGAPRHARPWSRWYPMLTPQDAARLTAASDILTDPDAIAWSLGNIDTRMQRAHGHVSAHTAAATFDAVMRVLECEAGHAGEPLVLKDTLTADDFMSIVRTGVPFIDEGVSVFHGAQTHRIQRQILVDHLGADGTRAVMETIATPGLVRPHPRDATRHLTPWSDLLDSAPPYNYKNSSSGVGEGVTNASTVLTVRDIFSGPRVEVESTDMYFPVMDARSAEWLQVLLLAAPKCCFPLLTEATIDGVCSGDKGHLDEVHENIFATGLEAWHPDVRRVYAKIGFRLDQVAVKEGGGGRAGGGAGGTGAQAGGGSAAACTAAATAAAQRSSPPAAVHPFAATTATTTTAAATLLGEFAATVQSDAIPSDVRATARRCVVDIVGCALGGAGSVASPAARHFNRLHGVGDGTGSCSIFAAPTLTQHSSPHAAAFANGSAAHALDFDDNCYAGMVHGTASVFPAVLAATQLAGGSGRELIDALVVGSEVEYALGQCLTMGLYERGWWSTSVLGAIGAAAGASRALSLDGERTSHAIALAAAGASGVRGTFGTDAKPYLNGTAAASGVSAAIFAEAGGTAPLRIFEDVKGFTEVLNGGTFDCAELRLPGSNSGNGNQGRGGDERWSMRTPGIDIKAFPVCYASHAAVEAVKTTVAAHCDGSAKRVQSVHVTVPQIVASNLVYPRPSTATEARFSLEFAIGCMLHRGRLNVSDVLEEGGCGGSSSTPRSSVEAGLRAEMRKVTMEVGPDAMFGPDAPEGAFVSIVRDDGVSFECFNAAPTGSAAKPMHDADLDAKFIALAAMSPIALSVGGAEELLQRLRSVEDVANVATLFDGLR